MPPERMKAYLDTALPYSRAARRRASAAPPARTGFPLKSCRSCGLTGCGTVELGAQSFRIKSFPLTAGGTPPPRLNPPLPSCGKTASPPASDYDRLPGETEEDLALTVESVCRLHPDPAPDLSHRRHPRHPMARWMAEGKFTPKGTEESVALCAPILARMEREGIPVIRVGLHPSKELESQVVGGCYHPAFKELCLARIWRDKVETVLRRSPPGPARSSMSPRRSSPRRSGRSGPILPIGRKSATRCKWSLIRKRTFPDNRRDNPAGAINENVKTGAGVKTAQKRTGCSLIFRCSISPAFQKSWYLRKLWFVLCTNAGHAVRPANNFLRAAKQTGVQQHPK